MMEGTREFRGNASREVKLATARRAVTRLRLWSAMLNFKTPSAGVHTILKMPEGVTSIDIKDITYFNDEIGGQWQSLWFHYRKRLNKLGLGAYIKTSDLKNFKIEIVDQGRSDK